MKIQTDEQYREALIKLEKVFFALEGTKQAHERNILSKAIEKWELKLESQRMARSGLGKSNETEKATL